MAKKEVNLGQLEELQKQLMAMEEQQVKLTAPLIFETEIGMFHYDYNQISVEQAGHAETMWRTHERYFRLLPRVPDEIQMACMKDCLGKFHGFLLTKIDETGNAIEFPNNSMEHTGLKAIKYIKGDAMDQMELAKQDFFIRKALPVLESEGASNNSIQLLADMEDNGKLDALISAMGKMTKAKSLLNEDEPKSKNTTPIIKKVQSGPKPKEDVIAGATGS